MLLLHGWPYDIHSYAEVAPLLAAEGYRVIVPYLRGYGTTRFLSDDTLPQRPAGRACGRRHRPAGRARDRPGDRRRLRLGRTHGRRPRRALAGALQRPRLGERLPDRQPGGEPEPAAAEAELAWWYQYYFATERGRAGYDEIPARVRQADLADSRHRSGSSTTRRSSAARRRSTTRITSTSSSTTTAGGWASPTASAQYDDLEQRLAERPVITVPTITIEGDANGAPHPDAARLRAEVLRPVRAPASSAASATTCRRRRREAFADAILLEVERLASEGALMPDDERARSADWRRCHVEGALPSLDGATGWLNSPAAHAGRAPRQGRPRRLLDLHVHQLAPHAALRPRVGREVRGRRARRDRRPHARVRVRARPRQRSPGREGHEASTTRSRSTATTGSGTHSPTTTGRRVYIADAEGRIRYHHFGEGEYDECERVDPAAAARGRRDGLGDDLVSVADEGFEAQADWANLESPETYLGYEQRRRPSRRRAAPGSTKPARYAAAGSAAAQPVGPRGRLDGRAAGASV